MGPEVAQSAGGKEASVTVTLAKVTRQPKAKEVVVEAHSVMGEQPPRSLIDRKTSRTRG